MLLVHPHTRLQRQPPPSTFIHIRQCVSFIRFGAFFREASAPPHSLQPGPAAQLPSDLPAHSFRNIPLLCCFPCLLSPLSSTLFTFVLRTHPPVALKERYVRGEFQDLKCLKCSELTLD